MIEVRYSQLFVRIMRNFPKDELLKIGQFVTHLERNGFVGLAGRNKSSSDIPFDDPDYVAKFEYAKKYNLWHYHIGIPHYNEKNGFGDYTSKYVIHYIKGDDFIKIVDFSAHPPFQLPIEDYLK